MPRPNPFSGVQRVLIVAALVLVILPRRSQGLWGIILAFSVFGLPAWLLFRRSAYDAVPWVGSSVVTAAVFMAIGVMLGLIALAALAMRGLPGPAPRRPTAQDAGAQSPLEAPAAVERRFSGKNVRPL
ncbi:MAG TPA: hypothetical protein VK576_00645 [Thermoleophilia bacterium]|nr:hypothetical protein [Thermoleophilia bacterium]